MNKKRLLAGIATLAAGVFLLAGCGQSKQTTLTVGASNTPQGKILNHVKPQLKKQGVNLKVKIFQDYVLPNKELKAGDIDANYFQHKPFLDNWNKHNHGTLQNAGYVHLEPIGFYSKKYKSLKDLPNHAEILVSNNVADYGRVLKILKDDNLITLKKGTKLTTADFSDIATNKKHLRFKHDLEPKLMTQFYKRGEGDAVVINANYAVQAGLKPQKDAIALEKNSSPYANLVAVRKGDKNKPAVRKLMKVLQSKSTQQWINKHFKGGVEAVYPNGK